MIMVFEGTNSDDMADLTVSVFQAAQDEASYCEAILPQDDGQPMIDAFDFDREEERATHTEPIPGHFHYADRAYWC